MEFDYSDLFPTKVYSFLDNKAKPISCSIGYLLPSILTSILHFVLEVMVHAHVMIRTHIQPINLYTLFIGYPGTGNSPAIEKIVNPLRDNGCIGKEI